MREKVKRWQEGMAEPASARQGMSCRAWACQSCIACAFHMNKWTGQSKYQQKETDRDRDRRQETEDKDSDTDKAKCQSRKRGCISVKRAEMYAMLFGFAHVRDLTYTHICTASYAYFKEADRATNRSRPKGKVVRRPPLLHIGNKNCIAKCVCEHIERHCMCMCVCASVCTLA